MAREHADIKMTPEELREFLATDRRLVLATLAEDDSPWGDVVAYRFAADRIFFRVATDTRSYQNIQRDPRVCCVVESKPANSSYYEIKGAILHGRADETTASGDPSSPEGVLDQIPDPIEPRSTAPGVIFSIGIDDSTSFVFAKIQGRYGNRTVRDIQQDAGLTS